VAIYRGDTVAEAELLAVSAQPTLVQRFVEELLRDVPSIEASEGTEGKGAESLRVVRDDDE